MQRDRSRASLAGMGCLAYALWTVVAVGGHIALIGVLTGFSGEVPTTSLMAKQVRLQGLVVGSRSQQEDMVRALETSTVRPLVDRIFPLSELADAFHFEESGRHFGKIGISI